MSILNYRKYSASLKNWLSENIIELRLYRTSERTVQILETPFQTLQINYDYIGLQNVRVRVLETTFLKLQWN
jgi:hypothetical protein